MVASRPIIEEILKVVFHVKGNGPRWKNRSTRKEIQEFITYAEGKKCDNSKNNSKRISGIKLL